MFKHTQKRFFSFQTRIVSAICVGVLCVASSCSSDSTEMPATGNGATVSFDVSGLTRSSLTSSIDRFTVYGDRKFADNNPSVVFNKTEVEYHDDSWSYQGIKYWFPNHEHSFVAVYPISVLGPANAPQYADSKLSFTYTLPKLETDYVNQEEIIDIVAATHRRLYQEKDAVTTATFHFVHLLSLVNFSIELTEPSTRSEESVKIHKLEMTGFGTSATINVEPAPLQSNAQTNDSKIDIVTAKGNGSLTVTFDPPIEVTNGAPAVKMFGGNNAIIMLPQNFAANEEVEITLTYSANDEAETNEVSATLNSFTWESGKSYNYKIKLELEQKEVNMAISEATIVPWNLIDDHDIVDAR